MVRGRTFGDFDAYAVPSGTQPTSFRPDDIRSISFGFGGYYGRPGERIVFDVSRPVSLKIEDRGSL